MKSLYEQEVIGDSQYAQDLLTIQSWYNGEMKTLNDTLAKKRSDVLLKYQERTKAMSSAEKTAAAQAQKQATPQSAQKQTGVVDTAGQPVTAQGGTPTVESYQDILRITSIREWEDKYSHIPIKDRNWYQRPKSQVGYTEWKGKHKNANIAQRKKRITNKVRNKITDIQYQIEDIDDEIEQLQNRFETPNYDGVDGNIEEFFGEIGPDAANILNSGVNDEEKSYALGKLGISNPEQIIRDYYYYYPEFDPILKAEREPVEMRIKELQKEREKLQKELTSTKEMYESINEGNFKTDNVDPYELQDLKDYLDAENISYSEDINTGDIDFDETELDREWVYRMDDMGLEEIFVDDGEDDGILTIDDDDDDEEDITGINKKIDEDKVFYVNVEDEGGVFIGKIYKLFDEGDWRSKIVDGDSKTFEKLNFDPEFDEIDIIAFLRDNYADAELMSEEEYNDHIENPETAFEEDEEIEESLKEDTTLEPNLGGKIDMKTHKLLKKNHNKNDNELKDYEKEVTEHHIPTLDQYLNENKRRRTKNGLMMINKQE